MRDNGLRRSTRTSKERFKRLVNASPLVIFGLTIKPVKVAIGVSLATGIVIGCASWLSWDPEKTRRSKKPPTVTRDLDALIADAKKAGSPPIVINDQCLVWDLDERCLHPAHAMLPEAVKYAKGHQPVTVFLVSTEWVAPHYRIYEKGPRLFVPGYGKMTVHVVQTPDQVALGSYLIHGQPYLFEDGKGSSEARRLDSVSVPIAAWINKCPTSKNLVGELRHFLAHSKGEVWSVAFSPTGHEAASAGGLDRNSDYPFDEDSFSVRLWDVRTGQDVQQLNVPRSMARGRIRSLAFSPDGRWIAGGGAARNLGIYLWDVMTGGFRRVEFPETRTARLAAGVPAPLAPDVLNLAFSQDGTRLLVGMAGVKRVIRVLDSATGQELFAFGSHSERVRCVSFSPDGRRAATGSGKDEEISLRKDLRSGPSTDNSVRLWDIETGQELRRFVGHTTPVRCVAFAPDGRYLLSGSGGSIERPERGPDGRAIEVLNPTRHPTDCALRLWDIATGRELRRFEGHTAEVTAVTFLPGGRRALSGAGGYKDGSLRLWDVETGREALQLVPQFKAMDVNALAIAPDGSCALSGGDNTVRLWALPR